MQAEREEEARRLAQEALTKKEEEAAARRYLPFTVASDGRACSVRPARIVLLSTNSIAMQTGRPAVWHQHNGSADVITLYCVG